MICRFIGDETGCEHCARGSFCTKPTHTGTWRYGCVPYKRIADHLNTEGHTTRFDKRWTSEQVKREIRRLSREPDDDIVPNSFPPPKLSWDQHALQYGQAETYIDVLSEQATFIKPTELESQSDIDQFLTELRSFLMGSNHNDNQIVVTVIQKLKTKD
jgi:hypothetical protein